MATSEASHSPKLPDTMRVVLLVAPSSVESRIEELTAHFGSADFANGEEVEVSSGHRVRIELFHDVESTMNAIQSHPVNVILIDNRDKEPIPEFSNTMAGQITPPLLAYDPPGRGLNRQSIFVIPEDFEATAHHAYVVGALQLGGVFVNPPLVADAIASATAVAAEHLGLSAKLGSVAPGKWADIIAVGGDPLTDITAVADIYLVIADGQVLIDRLSEVRRRGQVVALNGPGSRSMPAE